MKPGRAIVAGGSLGGLFAANLLHRAGWDVVVCERSGEELAGRGAGIVTHGPLLRALVRCGVQIDDTLGVTVGGRVCLDRAGTPVASAPIAQTYSAWGRLYELLRGSFPAGRYRLASGVEAVEQDAAGVTARLAGGERISADLLIAADGIRSSVRARWLPEAQPLYVGYIAWRGLVEESALSPATHAALFERIVFSLPAHEQMLGYPVPGAGHTTRAGERRYNFVWYRPVEAGLELDDLCTGTDRRLYPYSIAPPLIRPDVIAHLRADAGRLLAPQLAEVVVRTAQPFFQPIFDLESPRLALGRIALLGDAAFVARPHAGFGVAKAALDAVALADALSTEPSLEAALERYHRERQPAGAAVVAAARRVGAYLERRHYGDPRYLGRNDPEVILREVAEPVA